MTSKKTDKMGEDALKSLRKAVKDEFKKKAALGQYVIISRNGKTCRVSAKEALKMTKSK